MVAKKAETTGPFAPTTIPTAAARTPQKASERLLVTAFKDALKKSIQRINMPINASMISSGTKEKNKTPRTEPIALPIATVLNSPTIICFLNK